MIAFELPDFTANLGLNLYFARLYHQRPSWMQPDTCIDTLYGSFPGCVLNGGRTYIRQQASKAEIDRTFSILAEYGIKPRLTFTNMLATDQHLHDAYANTILEAAADHDGQVIVYADAVADYVRQQYGLPVILSTTRQITDIDVLNDALDAYDYVVLNYNLNKQEGFLSQVEQPQRLEIMVNEFCMPHCPHRQDHYLHNSQDQLQGCISPYPCSASKPDFFAHAPGHPTQFTCDEVADYHRRFGFSFFKIVGRGIVFDTLLESLCYYLVRPEYRDIVKQDVLRQKR